jgi:hypothetical protein
MRASLFLVVVLSWACAAVAAVVGGERELRADASFLALNKTLNALKLNVDTSKIPPVKGTSNGGYTVSFRPGAFCSSIGLKSASLTGASVPSVVVNGSSYQVFEAAFVIDSFSFQCTLPIHLSARPVGLSVERDGNVVIRSTPGDRSMVNFAVQAFSSNFSTSVPQFVRAKEQACADKFQLPNIKFSSNSLGSILFVNLDDQVANELNGASKLSTIALLQDTLCDLTGNLSSTVVGLATSVIDPLNALVANATAGNFVELTREDQVTPAALAAERALGAALPNSVDLVDLRTNAVVGALLKGGLALGGGAGAGAGTVVTGDSLFAAIAGFLGIPTVPGQNALLEVLDFFLNTTLAAKNGKVRNLNLLAIAQAKFPALVANLTALNLTLPGFGSVSGTLTALNLTTSPPATLPNPAVSLVSGQSIVLPSVALGGVSLTAALSIKAAIQTNALFNLTLDYNVNEDFTLVLSLQNFFAKAALLLPIDFTAVKGLELGPALRALASCFASTFATKPALSAALFQTGNLGLAANSIEDGLLSLIGDLVNNLVSPLFGKVAGSVAPPLLRRLVADQLAAFLPAGDCPKTQRNETTLQAVNLSINAAFLKLKSFLPSDGATLVSLAAAFLNATVDAESGTVALLKEPIAAFDFDPTTLTDILVGLVPRLSGSIESITLSNALPEPDTQKLKLLDVSPASKYFPRGLDNELQVFSQERPLALGVQARLADGNNPAQGSSDVSGTISLDNIALAAEIFLAYSTYDFESVRLSDVLAFSLDCFVAKLQQGGGLKALALTVVGLRADLQCSPCSQPALDDFFNKKLVNQAFLEDLVLTVNEKLVPLFAPKFTSPFDDTNWAATIKNATAKCNGIKITADTPSATPGSSDVAAAPAAGASTAVEAVAAIAGAATIVVAVVAVVLHRRRSAAGDKRPAATTDVAAML